MVFLYNAILTLLMPIWGPMVWWKAKKRKEQPNWRERQGDFDIPAPSKKRRIWIHAVSVGEFVAIKPILREIRRSLPKHEIVLTITTSSGHKTARESEKGLFDYLAYFPIDLARFQLAAMQRVQPDVVAVVDTELWLSHLWAAKVFGARTMLLNGRISDRSFPKARKVGFYYRSVFARMDRCLMQSAVDRDRAIALGSANAEAFGNCKFDEALPGVDLDWKQELRLEAGKPVLVIGSTRGEEEEDLIIRAIAGVGLDRIQVIHAPRHLESVPRLAREVMSTFGKVALRSKGEAGPYLVLDTYGELSSVYSVADIAVVGGGFSDLGGQNILQPLGHGKPVIHGPHMQNFRDTTAMADSAGAALTASNSDQLAEAINSLLADPEKRSTMGAAAARLIQQHAGVSKRYADEIAKEAAIADQSNRLRKANLARKRRASK